MESVPNTPPEVSSQVPQETPREPILTLPAALTAYVVLIAVIHLRVLLPPEAENWTIDVFGFIPKRYDSTLLDYTFPGGAGAKVWSFVTYSLLHANLSHIGFNVLWLLPFGSALARRFGAIRFFVFMAVTAAAGALAHLVTHEHAVAPMIGAGVRHDGGRDPLRLRQGQFPVLQPGRCRSGRQGAGIVAVARLARPPRAGLSRGLVQRQHHLRGRIDRDRHGRRQRRLAGAYRRVFRRAGAVFPVRSRAARSSRCCGCVVFRHADPHLIEACGAA
jgi:Rhomboid family